MSRELDARIHREIFGKCPHRMRWHGETTDDVYSDFYTEAAIIVCDYCGKRKQEYLFEPGDPPDEDYPFYSTHMGPVWQVVDEMAKRNLYLIYCDVNKEASFKAPFSSRMGPFSKGATAAEAICLAALAALEKT